MKAMSDKIAVLVDADNAQPCKASLVLAEVAKYGTASVKRAYGDWTEPNLKGWKEQLLQNSIQPSPYNNLLTPRGRIPQMQQWSLTRWICCIRGDWTAFAWYLATAILRVLHREFGNPV